MQIQLRFFASIREQIGHEQCAHQTQACSILALRRELADKGSAWQVLSAEGTLVAVNQELCDNQHTLQEGDEVAFFPFMTGG